VFCTRFPQGLAFACALACAASGARAQDVPERVAAGGGALVGASAAGLVLASTTFAIATAASAPDDARAIAAVLGTAPLAAGLGGWAGAALVGAERAWAAGLAGLGGAALGAGASAAVVIAQPQLLDDDLGAALLLLVALPSMGGALGAGAVAPLFAVAEHVEE
jgi:hypothetical protein